MRLIERIFDELPFEVVITGYGLTEGGTAAGTSPGDDPETIATTVGRPRPGFELRIVDGKGIDQPVGEAGEMLLRGGSIMSHYLDDPEATAAALSDDGWLAPATSASWASDGCLRIVGRSKDMFIVGGFNAYPAEIENPLLRHPAIRQAAVIGVPDERLGEVGMAFVVWTRRRRRQRRRRRLVREQMANYKAPRSFELVDELPMNATGKVEKTYSRAGGDAAPRVVGMTAQRPIEAGWESDAIASPTQPTSGITRSGLGIGRYRVTNPNPHS